MLLEFAKAAFLIFVAEMGDKTQILAMAFALQFPIRQVLAGVACGSLLNHGAAVLVGHCASHLIPFSQVRLFSALLFLIFGLWSLNSGGTREEQKRGHTGHPILVVSLAFFLGELGDKTQLTAIALAFDTQFPWTILAGTVLGMVLTSSVGIVVGLKLGERIPELALKLLSSSVFIGFGLFYLAQTVPLNLFLIVVGLTALFSALRIPAQFSRQHAGKGELKDVAGTLRALDLALTDICLGSEKCRQGRCPLGHCRNLVKDELNGNPRRSNRFQVIHPYVTTGQKFDRAKIEKVLKFVENSDLDPWFTRELQQNLRELARKS